MATYVLVAGAFHGAWAWSQVVDRLTARGHRAYAVDLTGQGARRSLVTPETDLSTHIEDVIAVIELHALTDVILVGHSYSGMVVTGVADRLRTRVAHLVYADAMVPTDGQSAEDFSGPEVTQVALNAAAGHWLVENFFPISKFGPFSSQEDQDRFVARLVPHPMKTFFERLRLRHGAHPKRTFISSTADPIAIFSGVAAQAEASPDWGYQALATGHDAMLTAPDAMADVLAGLDG